MRNACTKCGNSTSSWDWLTPFYGTEDAGLCPVCARRCWVVTETDSDGDPSGFCGCREVIWWSKRPWCKEHAPEDYNIYKKDQEITALTSRLEKMREGLESISHSCHHHPALMCQGCKAAVILEADSQGEEVDCEQD